MEIQYTLTYRPSSLSAVISGDKSEAIAYKRLADDWAYYVGIGEDPAKRRFATAGACVLALELVRGPTLYRAGN